VLDEDLAGRDEEVIAERGDGAIALEPLAAVVAFAGRRHDLHDDAGHDDPWMARMETRGRLGVAKGAGAISTGFATSPCRGENSGSCLRPGDRSDVAGVDLLDAASDLLRPRRLDVLGGLVLLPCGPFLRSTDRDGCHFRIQRATFAAGKALWSFAPSSF
jgi:hypothetical protein